MHGLHAKREQQHTREATGEASGHRFGENHAADSAAVSECTPVSMAPLEWSVSSR